MESGKNTVMIRGIIYICTIRAIVITHLSRNQTAPVANMAV